MDQYEIRNVDWREYLTWTSVVFGRVAPSLVDKARPDETVWRDELAYNDPYILHYFSHPSYNDYPVVGVTWEQAMDYCQWRTDRVNELALINAGIIVKPDFASLQEEMDYNVIAENFVFNTQKYLLQSSYQPEPGKNSKKTIFNEDRKVNMSDGILFPDFRLPTEAEWEFAAYGTKASGDEGLIYENQTFPWRGYQVRNPSKKAQGVIMANFVRGRGDMMGTSGVLNDKATQTAPVNWYYPNNFGLYNMAGNVNEWVLDVYRATTFDDMTEYNSFRGNIYVDPVVDGIDEEGNNVYKIDSLGRIERSVIDNGDKRSYKDGDPMSLIATDFPLLLDTTNVSSILSRNVDVDPTDVLAPKVSDRTRVYKGGSWKDRIYWLNPSSRRYLDQDKATNDIGFRCAVSMIGENDI
jgi:gliding motility-associated lipoprotein GldJ